MNKSLWFLFLCLLFHITIAAGSREESIHKRHHNCQDITVSEPEPTSSTVYVGTSSPTAKPSHHAHKSPSSSSTSSEPCDRCKPVPPKYEPQVIAAAVLLMVIGLYMMFLGFPFFIVTMAMTGFLLGSSVTWIALHAAEPKQGYPIPSTFYLCCCVGGGLLLAVASLFWWKVTIYLLCGAAGYLFSIFIWSWKEDYILKNILARNIIGLGIGFIFILGFVLIEFATVILSTSFIGAYVFILGLDLFVKSGFLIGLKNILDFNRHLVQRHHKGDINVDASTSPAMDEKSYFYAHYKIDTKVYGMMCAVFGLWIISSAWQRYYNRGNRFGLRVIKNTNDTLKEKC